MRLMIDLILASGSPRRKVLLAELGYRFDVIPSAVDELHDENRALRELCEYNASLKAVDVASRFPDTIVLGADTLVYIDETPLGKPKSKAEAIRDLEMLSGKEHCVCTGLSLVKGEIVHRFSEVTKVVFKQLNSAVITEYMEKVNVMDKAGAYAVQEYGELIIERVEGSFSNVVGLPQDVVKREIEAFKLKVSN